MSGGATTAANLGASCRRIHQSKTHGGWQLTQPTPGTFVWTSPLGIVHVKNARPVLPGWSALHAA